MKNFPTMKRFFVLFPVALLVLLVVLGVFMAAFYPALATRSITQELYSNRAKLRLLMRALLEYEQKLHSPPPNLEEACLFLNRTNMLTQVFGENYKNVLTYSGKSLYSDSVEEILRLQLDSGGYLLAFSNFTVRGGSAQPIV